MSTTKEARPRVHAAGAHGWRGSLLALIGTLAVTAQMASGPRLEFSGSAGTSGVAVVCDVTNGWLLTYSSPDLAGLGGGEWRMEQAGEASRAQFLPVATGDEPQRFFGALFVPLEQAGTLVPELVVVPPSTGPLPIQGHSKAWTVQVRSPLMAGLGASKVTGLLCAQVTTNLEGGLRLSLAGQAQPELVAGTGTLTLNGTLTSHASGTGAVLVEVLGRPEVSTKVTLSTHQPLWAYFSSKSQQLWVRSHFSEEQDVVLYAEVDTTRNRLFNQAGAYLVPRTNGFAIAQLLKSGVSVLSGSDTTPPIGTQECGLLSGNHGYIAYLLGGADPARASVGSVWGNPNGDRFVVASVGTNGAVLAPVPMMDGVNWHCGSINSTTTLTAIGGETTEQLAFTSATGTQLWPVVKDVGIGLAADGVELPPDSGVFCTNVTVRMAWDLVDPSTVDFGRAPLDLTAGEKWAHFEHRWEYSDFGNVTIHQTNTVVRPMRLIRLGGIQCTALYRYSPQLDRWLYVPGTIPYLGSDLSDGVPFNAVPANLNVRGNLYVDGNNAADLGEPPARVIEMLRDASGHTAVAYTFGYLPVADAAPARRLERCGTFIRFNADSLKGYPSLVEGPIGLVSGTNFVASCFTQVYDPHLGCGSATSVAWRKIGEQYRIEADFHNATGLVSVRVPMYLEGLPYQVAEQGAGGPREREGTVGPEGIELVDVNGKESFVLNVGCASVPHVGDLIAAAAAWTNGPLVAYAGDSIAEGHDGYHSVQHEGPAGDERCDIARRVFWASTNVVTGTNYGHGSQTFDAILRDDVADALSTHPKYLLVHCGVNDIANGRTWPAVLADLETLRTTCVASNAILILDDILPWNAGNDEQAATVREWNFQMSVWASTSGVHRIASHDWMGAYRASTGQMDNLRPEIAAGGVHMNAAGYALWADVILRALVEIESPSR